MSKRPMRLVKITFQLKTDATDKELLKLNDAMLVQTEMLPDDMGRKAEDIKSDVSSVMWTDEWEG